MSRMTAVRVRLSPVPVVPRDSSIGNSWPSERAATTSTVVPTMWPAPVRMKRSKPASWSGAKRAGMSTLIGRPTISSARRAKSRSAAGLT